MTFARRFSIRSSRQFIRAACPRKSITSSIPAIIPGQLILTATFKSSRIPHPFPTIPTRTVLQQSLPGRRVMPKQITPVGSLNGLTYLWQSVLKGEADYLDLQSNRYTRLPLAQQKNMPTLGFRSAWQFGPHGELVESQGKSLPAIHGLGRYVRPGQHGGGNPADTLSAAQAADGTHPRGTIYFVKNEDIRSRVRDDLFPQAVKETRGVGRIGANHQGNRAHK